MEQNGTGSAAHKFEKAFGNEKAVDYYDTWADTYDQDSGEVQYNGIELTSKFVLKYIPDKNAKLMDICAGTGVMGEILGELGYSSLDGLDGSAEMLNVARQKGFYSLLYTCLVIPGVKTPPPDNHYDGVLCVGSFLGGHLKAEVGREFARMLKPGGYCIIGMREAWLYDVEEYKDKLEPFLVGMSEWDLVNRAVVPEWCSGNSGVIFVFQKRAISNEN